MMTDEFRARLLKELDRAKNQGYSGIKLLRKYLNGVTLTRGQAIRAKCSECMCYYEDGGMDCRNNQCPLYPYRPFKDKAEEAPKPVS